MSPIDVLIKSITLLYRESQLGEVSHESKDLVRTIVEQIDTPSDFQDPTSSHRVLTNLIDLALSMCEDTPDTTYDPALLIQSIALSDGEVDKVVEVLEAALLSEMKESSLKRQILTIRRILINFHKEKEISKILRKANYEFNHKRTSIKSINEFINGLVVNLESLELQRSNKDPAILASVDISDTKAIIETVTQAKEIESGAGILRTGFKGLNKMLQGGYRRGETIVPSALQHNYKSGFVTTAFLHVPLYNKPVLVNPDKKPLILDISMEDELEKRMSFMFKQLKYTETRKKVDINEFKNDEIADYIRERLEVNGFYIKMLRVDPTQWTYKHVINQIVELETQGYEVVSLTLDYLSKLPTTGCFTSGPTGTDLRDMFLRLRNFTAARKTTFITPHQMSPAAKDLVRAGVPPEDLVKEVANKGYYERSTQLDQEFDVEIYLAKAKVGGETFLTLQRGKHRISAIADDDDLYFCLHFPKNGMPIPDDINDDTPIIRDVHEYIRELKNTTSLSF